MEMELVSCREEERDIPDTDIKKDKKCLFDVKDPTIKKELKRIDSPAQTWGNIGIRQSDCGIEVLKTDIPVQFKSGELGDCKLGGWGFGEKNGFLKINEIHPHGGPKHIELHLHVVSNKCAKDIEEVKEMVGALGYLYKEIRLCHEDFFDIRYKPMSRWL